MLVAYIEKVTGEKIADLSAIEIVESLAWFNEESQVYPYNCHIGETNADDTDETIYASVWEGQWGDVLCVYRMSFEDFKEHFAKLKEECPTLTFTVAEMHVAWIEYLKQL